MVLTSLGISTLKQSILFQGCSLCFQVDLDIFAKKTIYITQIKLKLAHTGVDI